MAHTQPQELVAVNQFFTSQLAYLCERMAEVKEGDRTLLDSFGDSTEPLTGLARGSLSLRVLRPTQEGHRRDWLARAG